MNGGLHNTELATFDELLSKLETPTSQCYIHSPGVASEITTGRDWRTEPNPLSTWGNGRADSMEELLRQYEPSESQDLRVTDFPGSNAPCSVTYPMDSGSNATANPEPLQRAWEEAGLCNNLDLPLPHMFTPATPDHEFSLGSAATQSFSEPAEQIYFSVQPDDVHFRYKTEVQRSNTSPIHGKGASSPQIQVHNLQPMRRYRLKVDLVNEQGEPSIHQLYKTKEDSRVRESVDRDRTIPSYEVEVSRLNSTISIENIGIQRKTTRGDPGSTSRAKRGSKDGQDSVRLLARLMAQDISSGELHEVCSCISDQIHDVKKSTLKISHINPSVVMETSKQEVTILCNKVKDDTQVVFSAGDWKEEASISYRHHGVALVVLVPECPTHLFDGSETIAVNVTLYCPNTYRSSDPVPFWYKMDVFPTVRRIDRQRSRSPVRGFRDELESDCCTVTKTLEDAMGALRLKQEIQDPIDAAVEKAATSVKCEPVTRASRTSKPQSKMADLKRVREVARGEADWSDVVNQALTQSPFVLHVQDSTGLTPLMEALTNGKEEVFQRFLDAVDPSELSHLLTHRSHLGASLLHLVAVPDNASVRLVDLLLRKGADPRLVDRNGQTILHWFVRRSRVTLMKDSLVSIRGWFKDSGLNTSSEMHSLVNKIDNDGRSALHMAVIFRVVAAVVPLLDEGADVNLASPHNGYTALHWAAVVEDEAAVKVLLQRCARPRKKTKHGATALQLAEQAGPAADGLRRQLSAVSARRSSGDSGSPSP